MNKDTTPRHEQQPRVREDFVLCLIRLFELATTHELTDQAVVRGVEAASIEFGDLLAREQGELSALFAGDDVFLSGQPLKASRATYASASELGELLSDIGVNEVRLSRGVDQEDLLSLLHHFYTARADASARVGKLKISDRVLLQYVDPTFLMGDGDNEDVSVERQVTRTFSSAVVVLRRLHESVGAGQYRLMRTLKRISQSLVMLAEQDPDTLRAVTAMRGTREDHANLCVSAAVTSTLATFMLTRDSRALSRVCLAALTTSVGEHRLAHTRHADDDPFASSASLALTIDETRRVPSSDAVALVALAGLYPTSSKRLPLAFESSWLAHDERLGPVYEGKIAPDVEALIISFSHKLHRVLAYDLAAATQSTPDDAVSLLEARASTRAEQYVLQLVLCAMEIFPRGTLVELSSGWQGVVLGTPFDASVYGRPTVRLMIDPSGRVSGPLDIDLALIHADALRLGTITRVLRDSDALAPALVECQRATRAGETPTPSYPRPGEPVLRTNAQVDDMLSRVSDVLGSPSPVADFDDLSFDEAVSLSMTGVLKARSAQFAARADADAAARSGNTASVSFDELLSLNEAPLPSAPSIELPDLSSFPGSTANPGASTSAVSGSSETSDEPEKKPGAAVMGGFGVIRRRKKKKKRPAGDDGSLPSSKPLGHGRRAPKSPGDTPVARLSVKRRKTPRATESPEPVVEASPAPIAEAPLEPEAPAPREVKEDHTAMLGSNSLAEVLGNAPPPPDSNHTAMLGSNSFTKEMFDLEFGIGSASSVSEDAPEPLQESSALEEKSSPLTINPLNKKNPSEKSTKFSIGSDD